LDSGQVADMDKTAENDSKISEDAQQIYMWPYIF
jgi:hypothetical protein